MKAKPKPLWLELGLSTAACVAASAFTSLTIPLIGGPAITENPLYYVSSITIGVTIYTAVRLIRRVVHQRTLSTKD